VSYAKKLSNSPDVFCAAHYGNDAVDELTIISSCFVQALSAVVCAASVYSK